MADNATADDQPPLSTSALVAYLEGITRKLDENRASSDDHHAKLYERVHVLEQFVSAEVNGLRGEVADLRKAHRDLADAQMEHSRMLTEHARQLTQQRDDVSVAKASATDAMRAASDQRKSNEDFQQAVTRHIEASTKGLSDQMVVLSDNDTKQAGQLGRLEQSNAVIVSALGVEDPNPPGGASTGDAKKARVPKLDQLKASNRAIVTATAGSLLLTVAKIIYELLTMSGHH